MSGQSIMLVEVSITVDTMLNFDGDFDGHVGGDVTCKQMFKVEVC